MSKPTLAIFAFIALLWPASAGAQYTPGSAPFDLIWFTTQDVDANGFPVNPTWAGATASGPNFFNICGPGGYLPAQPSCTDQFTEWDNEDADFSFFGECPADPFPGHLNWRNATNIGYIQWEGASGSWPNDNDINMRLDPPGASTEALNYGESSLGLEFDSTETINNFSDPFWQPGNIGTNINGDFAVVSGLLGVDGVHNGGWTEIHPVFALAIMTNLATSYAKSSETVTTTWQYFIRDFGNEGGCGSQEFGWGGNRGVWYLTLPILGPLFVPGQTPSNTSFSFTGWANYWTSNAAVSAPKKRGGVSLLGIGLPCLPSECAAGGSQQYEVVSIGVTFPATGYGPSFEDGVLAMATTFKLPKQSRMQRRPYTPTTMTQSWEEPSEPDDILAKITDPTVRSNVQAVINESAPVSQYPRDAHRGNVSLQTTSAPAVLSSAEVQQLSAVQATAEDAAHKQSTATFQAKLKTLIPSAELQRLTVPAASPSPGG